MKIEPWMKDLPPAIDEYTPDWVVDRWLWRPDIFADEVFGFQLWEGQHEIVEAMKVSDRITVKSGHKTGKSRLIATLAIWWAVTRPGGRSPMTSSSFFQVRKILWREITLLYNSAKVELGGEMHEDPRAGLIFRDTGSEVFGFSTKDKERAAGISSPYNFYQIDEASGRQYDELDDAVEGNLAGGGKKIMYSQATRVSGVFFDSFRNPRSPYEKITLNSEETPNVKARKRLIPGLATFEWVKEREQAWGRDSTAYQVRVLGEFPRQSDDAIIDYDMIHRAHMVWEARMIMPDFGTYPDMAVLKLEEGPLVIGADVAYFGNDSAVFFPRRGHVTMKPQVFKRKDGPELAGELLDLCQSIRDKGYLGRNKIYINVDIIGVGATLYDSLARSKRARLLEVVVLPVDVNRPPSDEDTYGDIYTELRFKLAEWLNSGGALPEDHLLEQELLLPEYNYNEDMKKITTWKDEKDGIHVLNKKLFRKLLKRSPDRSDGLLLSFVTDHLSGFTHKSDKSGNTGAGSKMKNYTGVIRQGRGESVLHKQNTGYSGNGSLDNYTS